MMRTAVLFPLLAVVVIGATGCRTTGDGTTLRDDESVTEAGARPAQLYRFDHWLAILQNSLDPEAQPTIDAAAKSIVAGPTRIASFYLQALCRIYADEGEMFEQMRDDFKAFEDFIGTWDKWNNILNKATASGAAEDVLQKLRGKREQANQAIKDLLKNGRWYRQGGLPTRLDEIRQQLADFSWQEYENDRAMVLKKLVKQLKKIEEKDYQFEYLEQGNGLHELRRDLRWLILEMRALNGLVVFGDDPAVCAIPEYQDLVNQPIAVSKYSQLPPSTTERDVCKIDQCIHLGLVDLVNTIGTMKDEAEVMLNANGDEHESDLVPPTIKVKVVEMYNHMVQTQLLATIRQQLDACR